MHREWNFALQCQRQSVQLTQLKRNSSLCFSFDVLIVNLTFTNILYLQMKRLIGQFRDNSPGKVMMGQLRPGPRSLHPTSGINIKYYSQGISRRGVRITMAMLL